MPRYFTLVFLLPLFIQAKPTSEQGVWRDGLIMAAKAEALPPNLVVRNLGILCLGMFETINAKDFHYQSYWKKPDLPPPDYQVSSALRGCALTLATTLHPSRKSSFSKIAHAHSLASGNMPDTASYEFGRSIANRILRIEWETVQLLKQPILQPQKLVYGEGPHNYFFLLNNRTG